MVELVCSKAGQKIYTLTDGAQVACSACSGVIVIDEISQYFKKPVMDMSMLPRKPITEFNCPMTLADPKASELVKEKTEETRLYP